MWFALSRQAQNDLVSSYTKQELKVLADFFVRNTNRLEEVPGKLRK